MWWQEEGMGMGKVWWEEQEEHEVEDGGGEGIKVQQQWGHFIGL